MHSNFFQGQMNRNLFYWPNHSGDTQLSKNEEEVREKNALKMWNNDWNDKITFYFEKFSVQNSNLYLNAVKFFTTTEN